MRKMKKAIVENKDVFVGLEDSKRSWKLAVRCEQMVVHTASMRAEYAQLKSYFSTHFPGCTISVIYEAGFKGFWLHDRLVEDGIRCVVIPPHLVTEQKVSRVKTDKRDAYRLARVLEFNDFSSQCRVPDKQRREQRQISRTLERIKRDIKVYRNHIQSLLTFHGIELGIKEKSKWSKEDFRTLKGLEVSESLRLCLDSLLMTLEHLWAQSDALCKALKSLCSSGRYKQTCQILQSVPGVGWYTAIRLALEWGEDFAQHFTSKTMAAFVGLTGREHSTGETVRKGGISQLGSSMVRSWLVEVAWTAIRKDPALLDKFNRVYASSGKKKKAIVAVARMLVTRMRSCVARGQCYALGTIE